MCGIAGILTFNGIPVQAEEIESLTSALAHRGRDSTGCCLGGSERGNFSRYAGIALGHRRLSIIDLSPQSAQPMHSQNSAASIVYNGELYNYRELRSKLVAAGFRFRTDSDSEVVLVAYEAWGEECLQRFNGMFAFAIWDESTQNLFCARDPVGIKPFYYTHTADMHSGSEGGCVLFPVDVCPAAPEYFCRSSQTIARTQHTRVARWSRFDQNLLGYAGNRMSPPYDQRCCKGAQRGTRQGSQGAIAE